MAEVDRGLAMRQNIYTVEVQDSSGKWHPGPTFNGLDCLTGYVGGHFTGSYERAKQHAVNIARLRKPDTTRICHYRQKRVEKI
jgi:hypothetical protein